MLPRIVIAEHLEPRCADWLARRAELIWCPHEKTGELAAHLATAEGLMVRTFAVVDERLLDQAPRLRVVGRPGVGLENIDLDACRRRGIRVVYTPEANTQAVMEYVLGLILDALRPRHELTPADAGRFHEIRQEAVGRQLDRLTLGILGLGRVGKRLGRVAHAIGMNLLACDLLPEAELRQTVDYPFDYVDHASLVSASDIVSIHVDGRPTNRHLISAELLARFKPDVVLINTARGIVMDHSALAAWARATPRARIALDVHDPEPPPPDSPLFSIPNVRLLPHLASRTEVALDNMGWVVKDVAAVLEGREPQFPAT